MLANGLILVLMVHVTSKIIIFITYRGRAGVKLGDACYIGNVTIIFDVPCLFSIYFALLCLHFEVFLYVYWTNLLIRCHSASCLFSSVFGSRKERKSKFSELDGTKAQVNILPWGTRS